MNNPNILLDSQGHVVRFTSFGCYPVFYTAADMEPLCAVCVESRKDLCCDPEERQWFIVAHEANWEDPALFCSHCEERIESAYAETYECVGCHKEVPWSNGGANDMPEHCDDCWAAAHRESA